MDVPCDLEMDVNGEEVFMVNKSVLSYYCGRIRKLFSKSKGRANNVKVIFHDFPGGAESFELIARFCYNKGNINVNPFNVSALYCGAHFMEMDKSEFGNQNLEKSLKDIGYWTWSELVVALRQCQGLFPLASSSGILDRYLDSLIGRVASSCEASPSPCPSTSSPESAGFRLSCDTRSTESVRTSTFRTTWWFDDLASFEPFLLETMVTKMVSKNFDHGILSKFIFHYQKTKFSPSAAATRGEKCKIMETVIEMLCLLDLGAVPCKNLFRILRVSANLNTRKGCRNKLQSMIGSRLDQATLDDLLLPGTGYLYDVNSVLKFLKSFLSRGSCSVPLTRLKKVGHLMDLYLAEVAPDPRLKPAKFLALIRSLPDSARDSHDGIYHAMDMYLEVHSRLPEEEKTRVCLGLNHEKLSSEARNHLAQNKKFPSKSAVQALISHQSKLKSLLQETDQGSPCSFQRIESMKKDDQQIVVYARKLDLSTEKDNLKEHLQGMQWRVMELEKVCRKMQIQMAKIMKSRLASQNSSKSLPRLCS